MALQVIGTGLGRTGTKSMQTALNRLGFGPCHHMIEVFMHPECMPLWIEAGAGRPDWDRIFEGYASVVDYPGAAYWRQITDHWPEAKVVHTQRDPEAWVESAQATIFNPMSPAGQREGPLAAFFASFAGPLQERLSDHDWLIDYFNRHNAAVRATIAPERLLVYEVGEGWERLCAFLGAEVPNEPFPTENSRGEFAARVQAQGGDLQKIAEDLSR